MSESEFKRKKRQSILEAALAAYARYGIQEATARDIAEIAQIGKSTIFEYFKSTDELMDASFAYYMEKAKEQRDALREIAAVNPVDALNRYYDNLISVIIREPVKLLLVSQYITALLSSGRDFAAVKCEYAKKLQPFADALQNDFRFIAETGIASGVFKPCGGLHAADCAFALNAFAREMQSQAFIQEEGAIVDTCLRLKRAAFCMLGCKTE